MQQQEDAFPQKTFGNSRWNVLLGETAGDFQFTIIGDGAGGFVKHLFRLRISPIAATQKRSSRYRPDRHVVEWETESGALSAMLVFPPEHYGAVLYVGGEGQPDLPTQLSLFTWDPSDKASSPYPVYDAETKTFSFQRSGLFLKARIHGDFPKELNPNNGWQAARVAVTSGKGYALVFAFGRSDESALNEMHRLEEGLRLWPKQTDRWWNDYFSSCPLVELTKELVVTSPSGLKSLIDPERFIVRQLWLYYWALASIVDLPWYRATPLQIADRRTFNQSFSNDNTFGIELLSLTAQAGTARTHLINLVTYLIGKDGHLHWSISADGRCSSFPDPHGVPAIGHALGHYLRATGDGTILDADADGITVWEKVKLYEEKLLHFRDVNQDGLVEWNHIWETGEDNKSSPFFSEKGLLEWVKFYEEHASGEVAAEPFYRSHVRPVTALNEQAFHLWSLDEMIAISKFRSEPYEVFSRKKEKILSTLTSRHWDEETGFYYDYDVRAKALWMAKNLDAFYYLYFEQNPTRVAKLLAHLRNPAEFALELLPSLAQNEPEFDPESYWSGAAWPREQGFVAISIARQGLRQEAFEMMVRVLMSEEGINFSETVNPLSHPVESHSPIAMTMCSVNQVVLLDICGLVSWRGKVSLRETELPVRIIHSPHQDDFRPS